MTDSLEISMAQMENRLRQQITELIQPTVQRSSLLLADVDQLKGLVLQHTRGLQDVHLGQFRVLEQISTIASFKEDMTRWDTQRRSHELSIDEKVEAMSQRIEAFKYTTEQTESVLHQFQRSVERVVLEINRLTEEQETQRDLFNERVDTYSKKVNTLKSDMEVQIAGLEIRHNALTDELWGEETGLAKVSGELRKTGSSLERIEAELEELQNAKAEAEDLNRLRADVSRMVHEATTTVAALKQTVGNVVTDVKEHFRTASHTISAHNAAFVNEVRTDYQEELNKSAKLRDEVQHFLASTEQTIMILDARVGEADIKASALAGEVREEIEELNRRRKRDKSAIDNELKALKKRLGGVFDNSDIVLRGIEHLYGIVEMVIKSEAASCAVQMQDGQDRKRIALIGTKDTETQLARQYGAAPVLPRQEVRTEVGAAYPKAQVTIHGQDPVIRIDKRCLGCSGQSPLVLSAFKMACLQYTPSLVPYQGVLQDRDDVLRDQASLLQKAQTMLAEGPRSQGGKSTMNAGSPAPSPRQPLSVKMPANIADYATPRDDPRGALSHYAAFNLTTQSPRPGGNIRLPSVAVN